MLQLNLLNEVMKHQQKDLEEVALKREQKIAKVLV
jgi:hypothetical protein